MAAGVLFVVQLAATLAMTGLIWFVQVVHYPLFSAVGDTAFLRYEDLHARRTGWVVAVPMLLELATACAGVWPALRPPDMSRSEAWIGAGLVAVIWGSTAVVQVPLHDRLGRERSLSAMQWLVRSNWVRTAAWTARSGLLLEVICRLVRVG